MTIQSQLTRKIGSKTWKFEAEGLQKHICCLKIIYGLHKVGLHMHNMHRLLFHMCNPIRCYNFCKRLTISVDNNIIYNRWRWQPCRLSTSSVIYYLFFFITFEFASVVPAVTLLVFLPVASLHCGGFPKVPSGQYLVSLCGGGGGGESPLPGCSPTWPASNGGIFQ